MTLSTFNVLSVSFPPSCRALASITSELERFGDIARLDVVKLPTTGVVEVAYFDARHAQQSSKHFGARAMTVRGTEDEFNTISVPASAFAVLPSTFQGFQVYGDVASTSIEGEFVIVEFFDMRAARKAIAEVPDSNPFFIPVPEVTASETACATDPFLASGELPSTLPIRKLEAPPGLGMPPGLELTPSTESSTPRSDKQESSCSTAASDSEKKETTDFEINPLQITDQKDTRTTLMMRNIPKSCTQQALMEMLNGCGLKGRCTFLYMPFDQRRSKHCGFAFLNVLSPNDVKHLFQVVDATIGRRFREDHGSEKKPELSYARIQGQTELTMHFDKSEAMRGMDASHRPIFLNAQVPLDTRRNDRTNRRAGAHMSKDQRVGKAVSAEKAHQVQRADEGVRTKAGGMCATTTKILSKVAQDSTAFKELPTELLEDKDFIASAVRQNPKVYRMLTEEMRAHPVVRHAIVQTLKGSSSDLLAH